MSDLWKLVERIDDSAEVLANASKTISSACGQILIATGTLAIVSTVGLAGFSIWEGREKLANFLLNVVFAGLQENPRVSTEWDRIPIEQWREAYVCQRSFCKPDLEKRDKIYNLVRALVSDTGAVRGYLMIYTGRYRKIAVQVANRGERLFEEDFWVVDVTRPEYASNLDSHIQNLCGSFVPEKLPDASLLRIESNKYNLGFSINCPIHKGNVTFKPFGYVGLDFQNKNSINENIIEGQLEELADQVEKILGYQE
jgi:hypothetical protein